jgi:outer membrane receptor protein involved in Fe transport
MPAYRIIITTLIYFLFVPSSFAQTLVKGQLTDAESGEVLIQATISLADGSKGTVTDFEGNYQLDLAAGEHQLVFSYLGYEKVEKTIQLEANQQLELNISLRTELVSQTVIVTEGKYEKKLEESTVSVDVIDAKQIQSNNVRSLADIVVKSSGVQILDGQVSIRGGAGYAYGAGSRVAFLVDGQQLLSAELSDVKWNFVPIENAAQIEIIKGSASVLYGSGALNGVINVRTAYPTAEPYTSFTSYAGVYENPPVDSMRWYDPANGLAEQPMFYGAYFAHREKLTDNFDLVLGGNFHIENGYIKTIDERRFRLNYNTRYVQPGMDGKLSYGVNGNIMYHEQGTYFLARDMRYNAYRNVAEPNRDRYLSITFDPYLTYYDDYENRHDIRGRWFLVSKQRGARPSVGHLFSGEYQFQRSFKQGWLLTAGSTAQHFRANSILFNDDRDTSDVDERERFAGGSFAFFAQVEKKILDRLSLNLGLRWEGFMADTSYLPMQYPIPRMGLNFEINKRNFLRTSFGSGFRFPSLAERFINEPLPVDGMSIGVYPNPDIKAETGWSTELGYRHSYRTNNFKVYGDIALFWMEYYNMVDFALGLYPEGLGFKSLNVSRARIAGWEISAQTEGIIGKTPLRIWGGYTYSYPGDLQDDSTQINIPTYLGNMFYTFANGVDEDSIPQIRSILRYRSLHTLRFDVETEWKNFTIGASANYNSHIHKIDLIFILGIVAEGISEFREQHNRGNLIFDWRLGYRFNDKQHLNFIVNNLLNTEYAARPAKMGAPRTWSLKYTHVF